MASWLAIAFLAGCSFSRTAERTYLAPEIAGLTHLEQDRYIDLAFTTLTDFDELQQLRFLRRASSGYSVSATAQPVSALLDLLASGSILYGQVPKQRNDVVISARRGHPLKSQYTLVFDHTGALLFVFVLPEG